MARPWRAVANASHELRTPLARQRTLIQVALADPDVSIESLRHAHERVLAAGEQQDRLIDALLTLARSHARLERHEPCDLDGIAAHGATVSAEARHDGGLDIEVTFPIAMEPSSVHEQIRTPSESIPWLAEASAASAIEEKHGASA